MDSLLMTRLAVVRVVFQFWTAGGQRYKENEHMKDSLRHILPSVDGVHFVAWPAILFWRSGDGRSLALLLFLFAVPGLHTTSASGSGFVGTVRSRSLRRTTAC